MESCVVDVTVIVLIREVESRLHNTGRLSESIREVKLNSEKKTQRCYRIVPR